jgi:sulfite dehydrogenase (cytochrome) subunit B
MRTLFLLLSIITATAMAGESQIPLKDSPGKNYILAHCNLCHSLDYITMHAKILDRAGWEKTVGKMTKVMGASISGSEKQIVIDYLTKNYGK